LDAQREQFTMKYYWFGCSHTQGAELEDITQRYSTQVSTAKGAEEINMARQGASNSEIALSVLSTVPSNVKHMVQQQDHVFVQWTYPTRDWSIVDTTYRWRKNNDKYADTKIKHIDSTDFKRVPWWGGHPGYDECPPNMIELAKAVNVVNSFPKMIYRWLHEYYLVNLYLQTNHIPNTQWFGHGKWDQAQFEGWSITPGEHTFEFAKHAGWQHFLNNDNFIYKDSAFVEQCILQDFESTAGGHFLEDAQAYWTNELISRI